MKAPTIIIPEFWKFVAERQRIWFARRIEKKPAPWTKDPILRDNRFTNMYRSLDKGTLYSAWEILYDGGTDKVEKFFQVVMYRLLNRISSYKVLHRHHTRWTEEEFQRGCAALRDKKEPIMTAAFIPVTMVVGGEERGVVNKIAKVGKILAEDTEQFALTLLQCDSVEAAHEVIRYWPAPYRIGPFVGYQILLDLMYPLEDGNSMLPQLEPDSWVYMGPGSRKSIGALGKEHGMTPQEVCVDLWLHQKAHLKGLGFKSLHFGKEHLYIPARLSVADIEHCLCEWYKYRNLAKGGNVKPNAGPGEYTPPMPTPPWLEA